MYIYRHIFNDLLGLSHSSRVVPCFVYDIQHRCNIIYVYNYIIYIYREREIESNPEDTLW